jgi:predicted Zn-dependent protease
MMRSLKQIITLVLVITMMASPARAFGLIRDAEIEKLVADYARPLLIAAGLEPDRVGIALVNDKSLNAFVANGQNMYIFTGLILEAEQPNMVIGVIAHEIGHITGGHLARGGEARARAQGPALIATILGLGSILAGAGDIGMALIAGGQQFAIRSYLTYSRGQEAAADNTALQLLEATGQSPQGIIGMMDYLANQEILSEAYQDPYARSHPMSRDRVNAYIQGARDSDYFEAQDAPELQARHDMAKAKIYGFLDRPSTTLRRYKNDTSTPARYARAIALYRQGRRDPAIQLVDELLLEMPDNAFLYELKGQIYYETGAAAKGIAPYEKSVALLPDEPLLRIGLATCQLGVGAAGGEANRAINEAAIANLRRALREDPSNSTAFFQLSKGFGQLGETAMAQWALAEYYAGLGSPEAAMHAQRALKGLPKGSVEYVRAVDILSSAPDGRN